ncbi:MAG: phage holin family protein [Coriobacteriales bacterium]
MMKFIGRWIATAIAAAAAVFLIPGIDVVGTGSTAMSVILFALVLALINASIKPILQLLGMPITIITLGIFYILINAVLLFLASSITLGLFDTGIYIGSWLSAVFAAIVISIVSTIVSGILGVDD